MDVSRTRSGHVGDKLVHTHHTTTCRALCAQSRSLMLHFVACRRYAVAMTNTSTKTDVRQLLTEDIDAQIAELRAKKKRLADAGRALVAAADDVDARKAAVADAEKTFNQRRQDLIELGLKPRAISRLLAELRATPDPDNSGPSDENSAPPINAGSPQTHDVPAHPHTDEVDQQTSVAH